MDTLRLLSRSSGLRFERNTDRQSVQTSTHPLPSAGGLNTTDRRSDTEPSSRKRKREEARFDEGYNRELTESEIRQVQKRHNIKITDLRALQAGNSRNESRKTHKEKARLFPQPLQSFVQLKQRGVNQALGANVAEQAFKEPTEVQIATIPLSLNSSSADSTDEPDLLTVAPTGSGKTLAFLIPLIDKISKLHKVAVSEERHVSAIILAPTKELVSQIVNEGRKLMANTGVKISVITKGMRLHDDHVVADVRSSDENSEHEETTRGTVVKSDIIVSTPLTLVHVLTPEGSDAPRPLLNVKNLILDEADVLLDPLFREQTLSIWSACNAAELRASLWSATIGASIEELAIKTIDALREHHGSRKPQVPLIRTIIGLKDTSLPHITHRLTYASTEPGKLMGLRHLLHPAPSRSKTSNSKTKNSQPQSEIPLRPPFLIFTQTIARAESLYDELRYDIPPSAGGSSRIAVLHSSLSAKQRSDTMTSFRQGKIWILITTDLLSRGVDFRGVNGVVNYDIPTTAASYVHRAGRTGRAGRMGGIVVTFYTREDVKYLKPIANIISASEKSSVNINNPASRSGQVASRTSDTSQGIDKGKGLKKSKINRVDDNNNNAQNDQSKANTETGLPSWLIPSLPHLTKTSRQDLKQRGVQERRAIKKSDDERERRRKLKNRIGTKSGFQRQLDDRKRGMIEASKKRQRDDSGDSAGRRQQRGENDETAQTGQDLAFEGFGD